MDVLCVADIMGDEEYMEFVATPENTSEDFRFLPHKRRIKEGVT